MTTDTKTTAKANTLAIIRTGSKQYVVQEGSVIKIQKLPTTAVKDGKITFSDVLLLAEGDKVEIGTPQVKASVSADLIEEGRDDKITVIHYKAKSRYFKKNGHRQPFMKVRITKIA